LAWVHGRERAARAAAHGGGPAGRPGWPATGSRLALAVLALLAGCSTAGRSEERAERSAEERSGASSSTWREAREAEESFRDGGDGASEACCTAARKYLEVAAADRALALLDEGLKLDPTHPGLLEMRGNALECQGFRRAAEASYSLALTLEPGRVSARLARAHLRLALGLAQGARSDFELALTSGQDGAEVWLGYAQSLAGAGEPRRAFDAFAQAFTRGPAAAAHRIAAARLLIDGHVRPRREADEELAAIWLRTALELAPDQSEPSLQLARLHEQRGELEAAHASLVRALSIEPSALEAWIALARVCEARGDAQCAADAARRALERERDPARRAWLTELAGETSGLARDSRP
jgi:Tfp pilus assembly protein PilF